VTIVEQGGGPAPQQHPSDQGDDHTDLCEGRHRGIEAPAGAIDFLGALVRPLRQLTPVLEKSVRAPGQGQLSNDIASIPPSRPDGIQSIPAVIAFVNGQPADVSWARCPRASSTPHRQAHQGVTRPASRILRKSCRRPRPCWRRRSRCLPPDLCEVLAHDSTNIAALAGLAENAT